MLMRNLNPYIDTNDHVGKLMGSVYQYIETYDHVGSLWEIFAHILTCMEILGSCSMGGSPGDEG